ncbi:FCD domain-containing protein [Gynuella sunshinyii]|uniref:Transcriptional regulator n=1 Tax=Gynuella sunshinyii YC6258 TaxID=1445510 RepID=A0A0C5V9J8_9GAMM|nr:FCD domain-containing protein [Gynuella sunshinyii]AJQ96040.1 transcriptional regulator [Gynuella sunshinyii YC6258]
MNLEIVTTKRLYQEIGIKLQNRMSSGQYKVGDRLPPERDIAEELGVSRSVVREAIIMLELQGFVEVLKGSGVYILQLPGETSAEKEDSTEQKSSDVGPFELLQARQVIESQIASFAANNVTKNDIFRLRHSLDEERKSLETGKSDYDGDRSFHFIIAEASQNSVLSDMIKELWRRREQSPMWQQLHTRITNHAYRYKWLDDHEKILLALQKCSPDGAREAMWQHIENVKQTLFELSDVDDPEFDGFLFR